MATCGVAGRWGPSTCSRRQRDPLLLDGTMASGSGGCNSFNGAYKRDGSSLTFSPFATTLAICGDPPGTGDQESRYFALLADVDEYSVMDNQLVLTSDGVALLLFSAE
ncbi:META domain-containing protein [Ilumatobacter sp.]|nr:META domain-containing protein [Ilumatobacter sp.]